ncbi:MAG TPA: hypothetical protein VIM44_07915 [Rariglobus sp.]
MIPSTLFPRLRVLLAGLALAGCGVLRAAEDNVYLLSSYRGNGDGLHLSYSTDAHHWTVIDGVFFTSKIGGRLFRDPYILRSNDGIYRMVWTSGFKDAGVGYAQSTDLIHWSEPRMLPLMKGYPAKNCWAPKLLQDSSGLYRIYWTSDVQGWFTDEAPKGAAFNNRSFQATTRDFVTFSEPSLLIEPGFDHNDPNIIAWHGGYIATFKQPDPPKEKPLAPHYAAVATNAAGPYKLVPTPIFSGRPSDAVGIVNTGDRIIYFVKRASPRQLAAYSTTDGQTWTDITDTISGDAAHSQGNIFSVPVSVLNQVQASAPAH